MKKRIICITIIVCCFCTAKAQSSVSDTISYNRAQIDTLDKQIINLIGQRMKAARAIGLYKMNHSIGVVQNKRFEKVLSDAIQQGRDNQLSEEFIRNLFNDVHKESIRQEEALKLK
ncbi:MAG TPA: chorismate mutase [Arachidicoccus sp.]|nr:chorismate mutase [Arachidicoccus sp.]